MKSACSGSLWGLLIFSLGSVACADQQPLVPEGLEVHFVKGGIKPDDPPVEVDEADPPAAEQDTTLNVRILGSGFDRGSEATWLLSGVPEPAQVKTNSTKYVSDKELKANITISLDATVALWDVEVMTRRGKKGIGIEAFQVKEKTPPGQVEFDDYVPIDLGTLGKRKGTSSAGSISDPLPGGEVLITGRSQEDARSDELPVMWEVTVAGLEATWIGPTLIPLPPGFYTGRAGRISDDTRYVVGWGAYDEGGSTLFRAIRWEYAYGSGFEVPMTLEPVDGPDDPGGGFIASAGRDVNLNGDVVGNSSADHPVKWDVDGDGDVDFEAPKIATFWPAGGGSAVPLFSPLGGQSIAYGVNNQGYVVGYGMEPSYFNPSGELERQAILWLLDGTPCILGDLGVPSEAYNLTDVIGGTILVSGISDSRATVWEVVPNDQAHTCAAGDPWAMEVESRVGGIRVIDGGWEAVGMGEIITPGQNHPLAWRKDFTGLTAVPLSETGRAYGVNGLGEIVGYAPVKDLDHAMLWLPKNE